MSVAILLDTNIIIKREDNEVINEDMQELMYILNKSDFQLIIHENSFKDIERDKNKRRKDIIKSKMNSYDILKTKFDFTQDSKFCKLMNFKDSPNDYVDNSLLYSLLQKEVSFLITEDIRIHKKANRLNKNFFNFNERVFTINEALYYFKEETPRVPYYIEKTTSNYLEIQDPIFDKLKKSYYGFETWFEKIQNERRRCLKYVHSDKSIGALLIYKEENENINLDNSKLTPKNRTKISTMIVTNTGYKIGELFLSWIIDYSLKNNKEEIYLTHFLDGQDDPLIYIIEEYGFKHVGYKNGELVYIKEINPNKIYPLIDKCNEDCDYSKLSKEMYPYFYDGKNVNKYLIPIKDKFHNKLFLGSEQQTSLLNYMPNKEDAIEIQMHTIKKAYISKANASLKPGDIILFYETPTKGISEIGVVEKAYKNLNYEELNNVVGKRSVYNTNELKEYEHRNNVILFIHSKKINKISPNLLIDNNIIKAAPQSIQKISDFKYKKLKKLIR